jgi:hypothetical protein
MIEVRGGKPVTVALCPLQFTHVDEFRWDCTLVSALENREVTASAVRVWFTSGPGHTRTVFHSELLRLKCKLQSLQCVSGTCVAFVFVIITVFKVLL